MLTRSIQDFISKLIKIGAKNSSNSIENFENFIFDIEMTSFREIISNWDIVHKSLST